MIAGRCLLKYEGQSGFHLEVSVRNMCLIWLINVSYLILYIFILIISYLNNFISKIMIHVEFFILKITCVISSKIQKYYL